MMENRGRWIKQRRDVTRRRLRLPFAGAIALLIESVVRRRRPGSWSTNRRSSCSTSPTLARSNRKSYAARKRGCATSLPTPLPGGVSSRGWNNHTSRTNCAKRAGSPRFRSGRATLGARGFARLRSSGIASLCWARRSRYESHSNTDQEAGRDGFVFADARSVPPSHCGSRSRLRVDVL